MKGNFRKGILGGGNWIIDLVKVIDVYPAQERLANILVERSSHGGAPFNLLKALNKMNFTFPLEGVGAIGDDEKGDEILRECWQRDINTSQIKILKGESTSYTDVMTVCSSGARTFFHYRGANALLDESFFDFENTRSKIFHLGYLLLLDSLDKINSDGLTGAATVFQKARQKGLITSADIVSEQSDRYKDIIPASLPFIDILFINEFEAKMLTGVGILEKNGKFDADKGFEAAQRILKMGVQEWVVIHFPKGVMAVSKNGANIFQRTLQIPPEEIKGTVGAGDAFAAGVLAGIHEEWSMEESLVLGVSVAAASLMHPTASGGILPWKECMRLIDRFGFNSN